MADKCAMEIYARKVKSGRIHACSKVKDVCKMLLTDMETEGGRWHFDRKRAERPVEFIERFCKVPTGKIGQPMKLELYEKAWVEAIFGFVDDDGLRKYQEVFIVVGRKNGKTTLTAAIELYMLLADGEGAPQIYNLANSGDQSNICFSACERMVKQSGSISKHVKKRTDDLYCHLNMGLITHLNASPSTLDGFDPSMATLDEIAAMKTRELYDLMVQAVYSRAQPLVFEISTNGFIRNSIFDSQYEYANKWLSGDVRDDRFIAFIYELDDPAEWTKEKEWVKSNPGLGTVKSLEKLQRNVNKAKEDPEQRATVLTKDFNIPQNTAVAWLNFSEAVNEETVGIKDMDFKYGICGFDAADTIDLTSAQMLMMRPDDDTIYERSMYWIPEDQIEMYGDKGKDRDTVPYRTWIDRGLLRTVPGNVVGKNVLLDWLMELKEEGIYTFAVGYDPWHMDDSTERDLRGFVGESRCFRVRQGAATLSQPMKQIRAEYGANRIVDDHHPMNEWCRMNVTIRTDINGNIQPYKKEDNPKNRIDGFAAELDAYTVLCNVRDDYTTML